MNEPHFYLFFLFNFDFHNLQIEKKVRSVINPRSKHRWEQIEENETQNLLVIAKTDQESSTEVDALIEGLENIEIKSAKFECKDCCKVYKNSTTFNKHMKTKHEDENPTFQCQVCKKKLNSKQSLQRHVEKCIAEQYTCSVCDQKFPSEEDMKNHKKTHTTCSFCGKDLKFASKLTRHMKVHDDLFS